MSVWLFVSTASCCARTRARIDRQSVRCSGLVNALLDDVLAGDELAGRARPKLLHGQAAHQLLVRRGCNLPRSMSLLALL